MCFVYVAGPLSVKLNDPDDDDPAPFPSFLPLHIFTDMEFDCRTPEEWLAMGVTNGCCKPVPGKALLPAWDLAERCEYFIITIILWFVTRINSVNCITFTHRHVAILFFVCSL